MNNNTWRKQREVDLLFTLIKDRLYKCEDATIIEAIDLLQEKISEERVLRVKEKYDTDFSNIKDCIKAMYDKREELKDVEEKIEEEIGDNQSWL